MDEFFLEQFFLINNISSNSCVKLNHIEILKNYITISQQIDGCGLHDFYLIFFELAYSFIYKVQRSPIFIMLKNVTEIFGCCLHMRFSEGRPLSSFFSFLFLVDAVFMVGKSSGMTSLP